ncbi:GNAT family N-acetyltransferase [Longispora albida]|uniref:GNAT family N-acetyltransferase n=1 Tax=Longispora albida TaxID=203523 RepID=UPI0003697841|nr:GNAT family N-acetyltransferase [Longispora albida]
MRILPFDPSSCTEAGKLAFEAVAGPVLVPRAGRRLRYWAAWQDDVVTGFARVTLQDEQNRHVGFTSIEVQPEHRDHGAGTGLLREVLEALAAEGRTTIYFEGVTDGAGWAGRRGLSLVQTTLQLQLDVSGVDSVPVPDGYRLVSWSGHAPEDLIASYIQAKYAIADAPLDGQSIEFPVWTAEKIRTLADSFAARDCEHRVVAAVHEATGDVAGITELEIYASDPEQALQQDTVVTSAHRGHGLGLCLKTAMLAWLIAERPAVRTVRTTNAASNKHMRAINERLGFTMTSMAYNFQAMVRDADQLTAGRRRYPTGSRVRGTIAETPWPAGRTGLFVDLGLGPQGFVDVLHLPLEAESWPEAGRAGWFEVLQHDWHQIRLYPLDAGMRSPRSKPGRWSGEEWAALTAKYPAGSVVTGTVTDVFASNREYSVVFDDFRSSVEYSGAPPLAGETGEFEVTGHSEWTRLVFVRPASAARR